MNYVRDCVEYNFINESLDESDFVHSFFYSPEVDKFYVGIADPEGHVYYRKIPFEAMNKAVEWYKQAKQLEKAAVISIKGLQLAEVLAALYNYADPQGLCLIPQGPENMSVQEARDIIAHRSTMKFDCLNGRILKINLNGCELDPRRYDSYNGVGIAQVAIDSIRK